MRKKSNTLTAKAKETSQSKVIELARQIELLAVKEIERESHHRRHSLESLYQRLCIHATKLGIDYPQLSTFYRPQEYLDNTRAMLAAVQASLETPARVAHHPPVSKPRRPLSPRALAQRKKHFAFHAWKFGTWVRGATDPQKGLHFAERMRLCQALADAEAYPPRLSRVTSIAQVELLLSGTEEELQSQQAMSLLARANISLDAVSEARDQLRALLPALDEATQLQEAITIHERCLTRASFVHPFAAPLSPSLVDLLVGQVQLREGQHALEVDAARAEVAHALVTRYPKARVVALEGRSLFQELLNLKCRQAHLEVTAQRLSAMSAHRFHAIVLAHPTEEASQERERMDIAYRLLPPGGKLVAVVSASAVAAWSREERVRWYSWLWQVGARFGQLSTRCGTDHAGKPLYLVVARKSDMPTDVLGV